MDIKALIDPKSLTLQLSLYHRCKRKALEISNKNLPKQSLEKKQGLKKKWTEAKDTLLIKHQAKLIKWGKIVKQIPGRSVIGCRL